MKGLTMRDSSGTALALCVIVALGMSLWSALRAYGANKRREYGNVQTFAFLAGAYAVTAVILIFVMVEADSAVTTWFGDNVCPATMCGEN